MNIRSLILAVYLLSTTLMKAGDEKEVAFHIIVTNNATMTGGPNDMGPTGDFEMIYENPNKEYKINVKWEIFLNGDPNEKIATRTDLNNTRIDALDISYVEGEKLKYGAGIEILGNLCGAEVQNFIHRLVADAHIPAKYNAGYRVSPTFTIEYNNIFFDGKVNFHYRLKMPIVIQNGIFEFYTISTYVNNDIYETGIDLGVGMAVDCIVYPDIPEFSGYPIRYFKTCTPETKLTIAYGDMYLFWELPLINRDIQNSIFGLGYRF